MSFIDKIKKVEFHNQKELVKYYKNLMLTVSIYFADDFERELFIFRQMFKNRHRTI